MLLFGSRLVPRSMGSRATHLSVSVRVSVSVCVRVSVSAANHGVEGDPPVRVSVSVRVGVRDRAS